MIVKPKDALEDARKIVDYDAGQGAAYSSIAQAEALTRLADAVEERAHGGRSGGVGHGRAVLDDHDEHLQAMVKSQSRAIDTYRTTIKRLRKKLRRAEAGAETNAVAVALWQTSAALWRDATLAATSARNALAEQLIAAKKDAASLPVWQPVDPGTVIKAGTLHRIEWAARPGLRSGEYVLSYDALASEGVRTLVVPRTVPAEPVGPDADAVEVSRA